MKTELCQHTAWQYKESSHNDVDESSTYLQNVLCLRRTHAKLKLIIEHHVLLLKQMYSSSEFV